MKELSFEQFIKELETAEKEVVSKAEEGLNESAEDLLNASQNLAPIDKGDLMGNGSVDPAKKESNEIKARVGYSKEYALKMHEDVYNLGEQSRRKPSFDGMAVGRKYLSRPLIKYSDKYADHITKKMQEVFR